MQVVNSYVFIPKEEKKEENVIRLRDGIPYIFEKHFNIDSEQTLINEISKHPKKFSKDLKEIHNRIIRGAFDYKKNDIEYKFICVDGVYYLDIMINSSKAKIIKCLTDFNNLFLSDKAFKENYIPIISYDYVSENYCNKLYPLLNRFERKFRKLLFLIFTSQFKELYFEKTASNEMLNKVKENIKRKKGVNKTEYRIQNYFYSIDMATLRSFLFDKQWTFIEEEAKNELLKKNLSKMTNEELKKEIVKIEPKSNWDRYFQNKGFSNDINITMETINNLRNLVAHNKIIDENDYNLLKNKLESVILEINKATKITESVDFIRINNEKYAKIFAGIREAVSNMLDGLNYNYFSESIEAVNNSLKELANKQASIVNAFMEGYNKAMDSDKIK